MSEIKRVTVLSTGGTIASGKDSSGRAKSGAMAGEDLMKDLKIPDSIQVGVISVLQKPSNAISWSDWLLLDDLIRSQFAEGVDGIVITHGTDTLEDTAYFLQCITDPNSGPIVVTGSQRVPQATGTDAFTNLLDAIKVAAAEVMSDCGVVVAFNETIWSADSIRKINTFQVDGFDAGFRGRLGYIDGDEVCLDVKPMLAQHLVPGHREARVDIIYAAAGCTPDLLKSSRATKADGIVIAGFGRGHVPPLWVSEVQQSVDAGIPVALVSSCTYGPLKMVYEFPGSLSELNAVGIIKANNLNARKARIRLMIGLSNSETYVKLADLF